MIQTCPFEEQLASSNIELYLKVNYLLSFWACFVWAVLP